MTDYQKRAQNIRSLVQSRLSKYRHYEIVIDAQKYTQTDKWTDMLIEGYVKRKKLEVKHERMECIHN